MKQITAHELEALAQDRPRTVHDDNVLCISPAMRDRLVATIRHLRATIRRRRDRV